MPHHVRPRISTIWDRTTAVLAGRAGILIAIAGLLLFVPTVAQSVLTAALGEKSLLVSAWGVIVFVLTIWATLALTAVASDPGVTRERALAIGAGRLAAGIGVLLLAGIVLTALAVPGIVLMVARGLRMQANGMVDPASVSAGAALIGGSYLLVFLILAFWLSARLVPLVAVIVNERRGLGAFRRAFALTRGSAVKLIGAMILFAIVLIVAITAATSVVGLILRLALGAEATGTVAIGVAVVGGIIGAGASVLQCVFSAQFYVATAGEPTVGEHGADARTAPHP